MRTTIQFTIVSAGTSYTITTFEGEYRNLMCLIKDKIYIEQFGDCGGMGRCGTCMIVKPGVIIDDFNRNENTTLQKMGVSAATHRLSCQVYINTSLEGAVLELAE